MKLMYDIAADETNKTIRFEVFGDTYQVKDQIKALGYRWDGFTWGKEIATTGYEKAVEDLKAFFNEIKGIYENIKQNARASQELYHFYHGEYYKG